MKSGNPDMEHFDCDVGDGLRLHGVASGRGLPLVLLHGFTGSTDTWAGFRADLDREYRVVAFDLPGHGQSSAPEKHERYSLDRFAVDMANALDQLALERVVVLGYSMGGRAALRFAGQYAERTAALVLISTSSGIRDETARRMRVASDEALAESIERDGIAAFVDRWERLPLWASQQVQSADWRSRLRSQRMNNDPVGLANSLRGAGAGIAEPVVPGDIIAPVLILAGALDHAYVEQGRTLAAELPDSRLEMVDGAGHAIHLERPESLARVVRTFLAGLGLTQSANARRHVPGTD